MTILGHVQRGGSPVAYDRVLATRFGVAACEAALSGRFGAMVALAAAQIVEVPLEDALREPKLLDPRLYETASCSSASWRSPKERGGGRARQPCGAAPARGESDVRPSARSAQAFRASSCLLPLLFFLDFRDLFLVFRLVVGERFLVGFLRRRQLFLLFILIFRGQLAFRFGFRAFVSFRDFHL